MIIFTKHASGKIKILKSHKFFILKKQTIDTLHQPERVDYSRLPLFIAQKQIDKDHVLRVVYKEEGKNIKVITFYPGRKKQYEK